MCFIFAKSQASRESIASSPPINCQFCKAETCVEGFQETRTTYLYGCIPTKPQIVKGFQCRNCHKDWFQGDIQEVVYTKEVQPGTGVVVTSTSVTKK